MVSSCMDDFATTKKKKASLLSGKNTQTPTKQSHYRERKLAFRQAIHGTPCPLLVTPEYNAP